MQRRETSRLRRCEGETLCSNLARELGNIISNLHELGGGEEEGSKNGRREGDGKQVRSRWLEGRLRVEDRSFMEDMRGKGRE